MHKEDLLGEQGLSNIRRLVDYPRRPSNPGLSTERSG